MGKPVKLKPHIIIDADDSIFDYDDGHADGRQAQLRSGSEAERYWRQLQYELMRAGNCTNSLKYYRGWVCCYPDGYTDAGPCPTDYRECALYRSQGEDTPSPPTEEEQS